MNAPLLKGGQGRDSADVERAGAALLWHVLAVAIAVAAVVVRRLRQ